MADAVANDGLATFEKNVHENLGAQIVAKFGSQYLPITWEGCFVACLALRWSSNTLQSEACDASATSDDRAIRGNLRPVTPQKPPMKAEDNFVGTKS